MSDGVEKGLATLLEQSHELHAITDASGTIAWANARFRDVAGSFLGPASLIDRLAAPGDAGTATREVFAQVLAGRLTAADDLLCRAPRGGLMYVDLRARHDAGRVFWTLTDTTRQRRLTAESARQRELLDTAQGADARALNQENAQLGLALDLGRIATWRHDLVAQRMYYNDRAFELLGTPRRPEGLTIEEVRSLIHPDDIPQVMASAEQALASDEPADMEARYRRADGTWRYVLTRRVVERGPAGQPLAFVGVALDISDRVEHSRAAEELARRLDAASRATGVGIWTTSMAPAETDWNAQMFRLFDVFEPPRAPVLSEWIACAVHPADRERVGHLARSYLSGGDAPFELEFRTLRRDGSTRWMVLRADVDRLRTGCRRVLGVAIDVTEQREAMNALQTASERAALITRYAGIGTWEARLDGTPEMWDEQMFQLRGLPPGGPVPDREARLALVHPEDRHVVLDARPESIARPNAAAYEFRVRLADGSYRWLASRSAVVFDAAGRPARRVGVNWDATLSKDTELARQQAVINEREMQARSQFLSRMSHELRTPLNAVLGFTQLLQMEARHSEQPAQIAKLGHIRAAGDHLLSLINDVLDLTSIESGEIRLETQAIDLAAFVTETLPLVESLAAKHGVTVRSDAAGGAAQADPTRLRQVLINLLSNAIKYNRRHGEVLVQARAEGEHAMLTIRDSGRGLSAEQIGRLFEPFVRFGVENEGIEGTGIGLTIVKALVEGMGGKITVTSRLGIGSSFEICLPAGSGPTGRPALAAPPAIAMPAPQNVGERNGRILYIEDNHVNVILVEELVRTVAGLSVASAPTGAAGVARAQELLPDVVLVDLQLPDFDGFEVLRRLRAAEATRAIPCIALSANAMPEDIERGLAAGFADYWTKPIEFAAFIASLQRMFPETSTPADE